MSDQPDHHLLLHQIWLLDQEPGRAPPPEILADKINGEALMKLACELLGNVPDETEAVVIYFELRDALAQFIGTYQGSRAHPRPTIGPMRKSVARLDAAITELAEAWASADERTKDHLRRVAGVTPFTDAELRPKTTRPADRQVRGAYRVMKFREAAAHFAESVATTKRTLERVRQNRRRPTPGLDTLTEGLADLYLRHVTGAALTTSRNAASVTGFIIRVAATLPKHCAPSDDEISWAVRRLIQKGEAAKMRIGPL